MEIILSLLCGLAAGALVVWLLLRNNGARLVESEQQKYRLLEKQQYELKAELLDARNKANTLTADIAERNAQLKNAELRINESKEELLQLNAKLQSEFENIANRLLAAKAETFTKQNQTNLDTLLKPLAERIENFDRRIAETHLQQEKERTALKEQLNMFRDMNNEMTREAANLVKALKGDNKAQGNWGEMILEKILERSGLQKDIEYVVQESHNTDTGRFRPDVVVKLPDQKNIVIDSKVSLAAYERYVAAENDDDRETALKDHLLSVRSHVRQLAEKEYQKLHGIHSPDFILLFIPVEPAFFAAVRHDDSLYADAFDRNIVIVSASTLLATLRTIHSIWKTEYQNKNIRELADVAGDLYEKFIVFSEGMIDLGHKMYTAKKTYEEGMKRLSTGRGNIVKKVEKLKEMGANTVKKQNSKLLELSDDDDERSVA